VDVVVGFHPDKGKGFGSALLSLKELRTAWPVSYLSGNLTQRLEHYSRKLS
jgi:hypothetical protein